MEPVSHFLDDFGLFHLGLADLLMIGVGLLLLYLALARNVQPLLMIPLGFGILVANLPISPSHTLLLYREGSVLSAFLFLATHEILPALIFFGLGAATDFGPLLASPRLALLGGAAQIGVFLTVPLAVLFGLSPPHGAAIAMIGAAHLPVILYTAIAMDPALLGAVAIAAVLVIAIAPQIQRPILGLLTTREERRLRMAPPRAVSRRLRLLFPILGFLLGALLVRSAAVLLGMLFLGNLLRESGALDRLAQTFGGALLDALIILLAFGVGLITTGATFLSWATLGVFVFGPLALVLSTASGILFAKLLNAFARSKINPALGVAGVAGLPSAARLSCEVIRDEDAANDLSPQALAPGLAGLIAAALTAGVFIAMIR